MKKLLLLWLLLPLLGLGQNKIVVSSDRVFAKADKVVEFEKALAAHAQKYHTGDWKWRVFEILSGPDAGGYQLNEGPNSWETIDKRGNLGTEHTADWAKNVAPLMTAAGSQSFVVFNPDYSTVQITDYADKISITRMFPKPGMLGGVGEMVKKMKKVWQASGESVAVYTAAASGPPQYILVTRMKGGLKEMDPSFRKPMAERFDEANGAGAWEYYLQDYAKAVESRWSELLSYRADLGSKTP